MNKRYTYIDALRGLAVILMVQQHLLTWLWHKKWLSYAMTFPDHPVMVCLNFAGNFAAPLFLLLAGMGSALYLGREGNRGQSLIKRGLFILGCGYILNLLTPHWFAPGSWYVLHTMGLCLMMAPVLNRIKTMHLLILAVFAVICAALLQTMLGTPLLLNNSHMNNAAMTGGLLRLVFAEGHFPLFPWLAFFLMGIVSLRWIENNSLEKLVLAAAAFMLSGIVLIALYRHGHAFATYGTFFRLFAWLPYFYPALPALSFLLLGIALFLLFLFYVMRNGLKGKISGALTLTGRSSLTWFMVHIVLFNEVLRMIGLHRTFSAEAALLITGIFIFILMYLSALWGRIEFKYGFEWLMRKLIR